MSSPKFCFPITKITNAYFWPSLLSLNMLRMNSCRFYLRFVLNTTSAPGCLKQFEVKCAAWASLIMFPDSIKPMVTGRAGYFPTSFTELINGLPLLPRNLETEKILCRSARIGTFSNTCRLIGDYSMLV